MEPSQLSTLDHEYHSLFYPVSSLHYLKKGSNNWPIKVRVIKKHTIKIDPPCLVLNLIDEWKGEIQAMAFRDEYDRFFNFFEVNKCFSISMADLKPADREKSPKHESIIYLTSSTIVIEIDDDDNTIPFYPDFCFVPIKKVLTMEPGSFVDVIGYATPTGPLSLGLSSSQRQYKVRRLKFIDETSGDSIELSVWNEFAHDFDAIDPNSTFLRIALRCVKLVFFNQKPSLSTTSSTILKVEQELDKISQFSNLKQHLTAGRALFSGSRAIGNATCSPYKSPRKQIEGLGEVFMPFRQIEDIRYYSTRYNVRATVAMISRDSRFYEGCILDNCKKKVELINGLYYCKKCQKEYSNFRWRLLLKLELYDFSGCQKVVCFQEGVQDILGDSIFELLRVFGTTGRLEEFWNFLNACLLFQKFNFYLLFGSKPLSGDSTSVTVLRISRIDQVVNCRKMIQDLCHDRYNRMLPVPRSLTQQESIANMSQANTTTNVTLSRRRLSFSLKRKLPIE